jgi:hypothetical protein
MGGEGELTSGSKSGDHRLQNLGHHRGERERWRRGGCYAGKLNEKKEEKGERGRAWERGRGARARGLERARLGRARSRRGAKNPRNTQPPIGIRMRTKIRNETR